MAGTPAARSRSAVEGCSVRGSRPTWRLTERGDGEKSETAARWGARRPGCLHQVGARNRRRRDEHQQQARDEHLRHQLHQRPELPEIVDDSEQRHQARAEQERQERAPVLDDAEPRREPGDDCQPSEEGHRPVVPAIVDRHDEIAPSHRKGTNRWRRTRGHDCGDRESGESVEATTATSHEPAQAMRPDAHRSSNSMKGCKFR